MLNSSQWIKWLHGGTKPAETQMEKAANALLGTVSIHCAKCLTLNGCFFPENNMPPQPLHPNCHCTKEYITTPMPNISAFAKCSIEKITKYAFVNSAKKRFFEINGYDIMDAEMMHNAYITQAVKKYASGDFSLGMLDEYGQRINIRIYLPAKKTSNDLSFITGWMVYPNGNIILTTPATNLSSK